MATNPLDAPNISPEIDPTKFVKGNRKLTALYKHRSDIGLRLC